MLLAYQYNVFVYILQWINILGNIVQLKQCAISGPLGDPGYTLIFPGRIEEETYTNTWDPEYFQCKASTELDGLRIFAIEIIYDRLINGIQFHYSKRSDNNTNYSGNGSRVLGEYSLQQIHWEGHALGEVSKMQIDDTSMTIGGVTIPIVEWRNGIRTAMKCRLGACPALNIQEGEFEFTDFYTYFQGHVERESGGEAILYRGT